MFTQYAASLNLAPLASLAAVNTGYFSTSSTIVNPITLSVQLSNLAAQVGHIGNHPLALSTPIMPLTSTVYNSGDTGIIDFLQFNMAAVGDFLTPASHTRPSTVASGGALDISGIPAWYGSVDSARPVRLNSKLQDPALFCFKLEDFPSSRIKFSQKLLFD